MEKTWENIRDEIVKIYKIVSITHDGKLLTMADTMGYTYTKSWIFFSEYQSEHWVEIYAAMDDSVSIDEILKSQENNHPAEGLEPLDDTIMAGFINISNPDIHKIVTKLEHCEIKSLISTLTCFQEAADQIEDEDLEKSQMNKHEKSYILRICSRWDIQKKQYDGFSAQLKDFNISEDCRIVCHTYEADLPDEEYEHWLDDMIKREETSEEEYVNFCRSHGLSEERHPPDLKAAKLLYYTNVPRLIADLVLTDREQIVRMVFPEIVEFSHTNGLLVYDWHFKGFIDLDNPGQLPPGWAPFIKLLSKL
jgi:hypothetical protein